MPIRTMTQRRPIALAVAVVASVVVAACGSSDPHVTAGRARPIEIDTTTGHARWSSLQGVEEQRLAQV